jgi:hypothetical protein
MRTFRKIAIETGLLDHLESPVKPVYKYFALIRGEVSEFPTHAKATEFVRENKGKTFLIEKVLANKADSDSWVKTRSELFAKTIQIWEDEISSLFDHLSAEQGELIRRSAAEISTFSDTEDEAYESDSDNKYGFVKFDLNASRIQYLIRFSDKLLMTVRK